MGRDPIDKRDDGWLMVGKTMNAGKGPIRHNLTQLAYICCASVCWEAKMRTMFDVHEAKSDFSSIQARTR